MNRALSLISYLNDNFTTQKSAQNTYAQDRLFKSFDYFSSDKNELNNYTRNPYVAIAVDVLIQDVGGREFWFEDQKGVEIDTFKLDESISGIFINAQKPVSFTELMGIAMGHLALTGNALFLKTQASNLTANGKLTELVLLNPGQFKSITQNNGTKLKGYELKLEDGIPRFVAPDNVIHLRLNAIKSRFWGIGNIEKAFLDFESQYYAKQQLASFYEKGATPQLFISTSSQMGQPEAERTTELLNKKYTGNSGKSIMFMAGEDVKAQQFQVSNRDMQFLDILQFNREQTLQLFKVWPERIGLTNNTVKATIEKMVQQHYEQMNKYIKLFEDAFNFQHVHLFDKNKFIRFKKYNTGNLENLVTMIQNGIVTPGQAAIELGYDAENPDMDNYYLGSNLVPIGYDFNSKTKNYIDSSVNQENTKPSKFIENENKSIKGLDIEHYNEIANFYQKSATFPKKFQVDYIRRAFKSRYETSKKYEAQLSDFFNKQSGRVIEKLKSLQGKSNKFINDDDNIGYILIDENENDYLSDLLKKIHTSAIQKAVLDIILISGVSIAVSEYSISSNTVKQSLLRLGDKITRINEYTRKEVEKIVINGVKENFTINEIAEELQSKFIKFRGHRSRRIARTESRMAYDHGTKIAYEKLDVKFVDVVGCTEFEPDSDCGKQNIAVTEMLSSEFHPNHIGTFAPNIDLL